MLRRRRRGSDGEGESLDDMLNSVPKVNEATEEIANENDAGVADESGVRVPSGMITVAQILQAFLRIACS